MVPEIWSKTSRIFCHFLDHFLLFYPKNQLPKKSEFWKTEKKAWRYYHVYHKWQSYYVWFLRYKAWQTRFFCHFELFFAFLPSKQPKKSQFWKIEKKTPGDIIILHMCTINDDHMMYGSWDMKPDKQNFLSFWTVFCIFTPLTT